MGKYEEECEKVRLMNENERFEFNFKLFRKRGQELRRDGSVLVFRNTCGSRVDGFAIDPLTLKTEITRNHFVAKEKLVKELAEYYGYQTDKIMECQGRVINGLIFLEIDGFSSNILQLWVGCSSEKDKKKIVRFFKKHGVYIPVDPKGKLIEG